MLRPSFIVIALVALAGLAACGGNDANSDNKPVTATAADVQRYCALTRELDTAGEQFFAGLGEDASPDEFEAAERRFIERFAGKLKELERVAPRKIKADVRTILADGRQRAGLRTATKVSESEASAADETVRAYEKRNCSA